MTFNLPFEIDATSKKVSDFLLAKESWDHKSEFKGTHCVIIDNQCVPLLVVAFSATSNEMMLEAISSLVEMTETDACVELTDIAAKFIQATKEELFLSQNPPETDENLSDDEAREAFLALSKVMAPEDFNEFTEKIFEPKPLKEVSVPSIYAIPPEVEANYLSKGIRLIPTPPGQ